MRYRHGVTVSCTQCGRPSLSGLCSRHEAEAKDRQAVVRQDELHNRVDTAVRRLAYLKDRQDEHFEFYDANRRLALFAREAM